MTLQKQEPLGEDLGPGWQGGAGTHHVFPTIVLGNYTYSYTMKKREIRT